MNIDSTIPDPFGYSGYQGTLDRSADRAETEKLLTDKGLVFLLGRVIAFPDVARYSFPNGWGAAVLLASFEQPACINCDAGHPFEMAVLHGRNKRICYASELTTDLICGLGAAGVRRWLKKIAALEPKRGCRHLRPSRRG